MNVVYSYHTATRKYGVCQGTLWRQLEQHGSHHPQASFTSSSSSASSCEYCVLTGVRLRCYESLLAYQRGDACWHSITIVGASAYQPVTKSSSTTTSTTTTSSNPTETSFRLVSHQGTHYFCQAPTSKCRDVWLSTLYAGLEQALLQGNDIDDIDTENEKEGSNVDDENKKGTSSTMNARGSKQQQQSLSLRVKLYPSPEVQKSVKRSLTRYSKKFCHSCGSLESSSKPLVTLSSVGSTGVPLWQYGKESKCDVCYDCFVAQGLLDHLEFVHDLLLSSYRERHAINQALQLLRATFAEHSVAPAELAEPSTTAAGTAGDAPHSPPTTTKPDDESNSTGGGDESSSWTQIGSDRSSTPSPPDPSSMQQHALSSSWQSIGADTSSDQPIRTSTWVQVPPTHASTTAILEVLQSSQLAELARISPLLEQCRQEVLNGLIDVSELLEQLELASHQRTSHQSTLKQQAFRVAGDMGSAMKLLSEHALRENGDPDMLRCILDFFLDLCEARAATTNQDHRSSTNSSYDEEDDGGPSSNTTTTRGNNNNPPELFSIAFFWPQLCHIHLRMLPPKNYNDVARIELMEDFLLTIAAKHSIHLALELTWSHTADLEESILSGRNTATNSTTASGGSSGNAYGIAAVSQACRRRRFAVLRFVCELESLLFDFDGAWGGGSVSLGKMLQPTGHQVELLKHTMKNIQKLRQKWSQNRLSRSFLLETLSSSKFDRPPDVAVQEKLRIARNADYFSSHLNFTRRLCDTAEKLRFMEIDQRVQALQQELELLNSSGAMGGDPLNRLRNDLVRVVRVPATEGHVFRSKERTPVLLLMEVVSEGAQIEILRDRHHDSGAQQWSASTTAVIDDTETSEVEEAALPSSIAHAESTDTYQTAATEGEELVQPDGVSEHSELSREASVGKLELEGSLHDKPSPRPTGLKRFDGASGESVHETPVTPKSTVELLVSSAMEQQLHDISVPDLSSPLTTPERLTKAESMAESEPLDMFQDAEQGPLPTSEDEPPRSSPEDEPPKSPSDTASPTQDSDRCEESRAEGHHEVLKRRVSKKKTALGGLTCSPSDRVDSNVLAPTGDVRREVLTAIMMRGMQGKDSIAAGTADSVQRSLKELERQRATELLLTGSLTEAETDDDTEATRRTSYSELESTRQKLVSLGIGSISPSSSAEETSSKSTSEEDEVMEAIRLLLIQNRVAQGQLSEADAALVLQHTSLSRRNSESEFASTRKGSRLDPSEMPTIDAGDVDTRLVGCGALPPAILQAITLWKAEMVSNAELLELVKKDLEFLRHSVLLEAENIEKLHEDSAFWGRFAFGERWAEKKSRIASSSPEGSAPGWDLVGVIVKSNDDLRQESFVMQLIELCQEAFELSGVELWVNPYRILATGRTTGVIEMVRNAMSFDALKKRPGYGKGGLREHLHRMTEFTADPGGAFKAAQQNFVRSLASYSLLSYLFQIKDRHNGNLLLDTAGHVIHIDFGFVFGIAPGGSFSLEMSTPFKLTEEMLDVMGGLKSPLFSEFVTLFCCGFLALQPYAGTFLTIVEIMCKDSTFKCFDGRDTDDIVSRLRERFSPDLSKEETVTFALDLIRQAVTSYGTRQYDMFQYLSQGIAT